MSPRRRTPATILTAILLMDISIEIIIKFSIIKLSSIELLVDGRQNDDDRTMTTAIDGRWRTPLSSFF